MPNLTSRLNSSTFDVANPKVVSLQHTASLRAGDEAAQTLGRAAALDYARAFYHTSRKAKRGLVGVIFGQHATKKMIIAAACDALRSMGIHSLESRSERTLEPTSPRV